MSTQRYSESRSIREESRRGNNGSYDLPVTQSRVSVPIQSSSSDFPSNPNQQRVHDRLRLQDTTVQWVNDPITGVEKFRVTINIDGFNQNEVSIRVEGNKLIVSGEHVENKTQSTAKKIIEKSYELPHDIDVHSPHVTFPSAISMQVDFPSRHSNVIYDDGRTSSRAVSSFDTSRHTPTRFAQERTSSEFTSTRKLGGNTGTGTSFERSSIARPYSSYEELQAGPSVSGNSSYYTDNSYQTPSYRGYEATSSRLPSTYGVIGHEPSRVSTYPSPRVESGGVRETNYSETHRESQHRRSSPTSGVQSSREFEHHRSGSPSIARTLDDDRFRTSLNLGSSSIAPPSLSRNTEVREYSRRIGGNSANNSSEPSLFAQGFNSDAFYRSAFQPRTVTDDRGQQYVEMKLEVNNYQPSEIKVSVDGNDLVVQAEHNDERPPTSSSRAYFFKQITLPPNTDLNSLSSQYHPDGKLHITAKLVPEQGSIKYN